MLEFRPHHFLCTVGFLGKGYSPEFVANYTEIANRLRKPGGDAIRIRVTAVTDSICSACPSKMGDECETQEKIDLLDGAHARVLGIRGGDELTWGEAKTKIVEKFTLEKFHAACEPCSWKAMGVCEIALSDLKKGISKPPL
jgi:hypothetical protein